MKLSLYSYLFERDNLCYLYNSQTGLLTTISQPVYEKLYNNDFDSLSEEILKILHEKKVIVADDKVYDYYYSCRNIFLSSIGNRENLSLTIAPTKGCNFACPYCFEGEKENVRMTPQIVDNLIKYIQSYGDAKNLSISWFGGEPLLAFDVMKDILKRIKNECPQKLYSQSIITNGYLIDEKIIDFFVQENFSTLQITLDGTEANHNKTRFLKGNMKPTYQRIMENVDKLVAALKGNIHISLRVNINRENELDFLVIYKEINEKYKDSRVSVYPGLIREPNTDCSRLCYRSLSGRSLYNFYKKMDEQGINVDFYPRKIQKGCMICHNTSLVIGPEGELYKCWSDFNDSRKVIGNIKDKKFSNPTLVSRYALEATPYSNPKCKECKVFPVCSGGCGWLRFQNVYEDKNYELCTYLSDNSCLEECLLKKSRKEEIKISAW